MLVWDPVEGKYLPDATPSYGKDTVRQSGARLHPLAPTPKGPSSCLQ